MANRLLLPGPRSLQRGTNGDRKGSRHPYGSYSQRRALVSVTAALMPKQLPSIAGDMDAEMDAEFDSAEGLTGLKETGSKELTSGEWLRDQYTKQQQLLAERMNKAGAGLGTRVRNLEATAPKLVDAGAGLYKFEFASPSTAAEAIDYPFFLDPKNETYRMFVHWLHYCAKKFHTRKKAPLYLNGLTKSGKSAALNALLPAVIERDPVFGVEGPQELLICRLDLTTLPVTSGYNTMLKVLLNKIYTWATDTGIAITPELAAQLQRVFQAVVTEESQRWYLEQLINDLLSAISTPTIMLVDEVQKLFQPVVPMRRTSEAERPVMVTDNEAMVDVRRFWKQVTLYGPPNVLWAATGSGLALFWTSLGLSSTSDLAPLTHQFQVPLPAKYSYADLHRCAEQLSECAAAQGDVLPSVAEMVDASCGSVAIMAFAASNWDLQQANTSYPTYQQYFDTFIWSKIFSEVAADWSLTLPLLAPSDRLLLLGLSDVARGAQIAFGFKGLDIYLAPYVEDVNPTDLPGYKRLVSQHHRILMKVAVTEEGFLRGSLASIYANKSIGFGEDYLLLIRLGNTVGRALSKEFASPYKQVKETLEAWVRQLSAENPDHSTWHKLPWSQQVMLAAENSKGTKDRFEKKLETLSAVEVLAWYHRMLRNCLAHAELDPDTAAKDADDEMEVKLLLSATQRDVDLVRSWPLAAGQGISEALYKQLEPLSVRSGSCAGGSSDDSSEGDSSESDSTGSTSSRSGRSSGKARALTPSHLGGPLAAIAMQFHRVGSDRSLG